MAEAGPTCRAQAASGHDSQDQPAASPRSAEPVQKRSSPERSPPPQEQLLSAVNRVLQEALVCETDAQVARKCLEVAQELTASQLGFIGEVNRAGLFDTIAISAAACEACRVPESDAVVMLKDMRVRGIWGSVLKAQRSQIVNDPDTHPDRVSTPQGHPPIRSFLGVPLTYLGRTFGMIGLANKHSGYDLADQQAIEALSVAFVGALTHKRAEQERERLIAELEAKNAELERFAYTISHDLKTPLITIQGFSSQLEHNIASGRLDRTAEDAARIRKAAQRMHQLLDGLAELARIDRAAPMCEEVRLGELTREAVELAAVPIARRGVQVVIDPGLPVVQGDRPRLAQVMQNLVNNAVKFMGDQAEPRLEITTRGQTGKQREVVCCIRDNGIGIEPRYHETVFGIFDQLDPKAEGVGLGLAIARRIVQMHGGRIWVESEGEGGGCTFCFSVPCRGGSTNDGS